MQLNTTYKQILSISLPIMIGSAAQNMIVLSDNVFLYHFNSDEFGAIGLVGVFYLVVAAIGYGFSRGGQIIIARKYGEGRFSSLAQSFHSLFLFELLIAILLFTVIQLGAPYFFSYLSSPVLYEKCLAYIYPRSYGIFFSYLGVSLIALYTAIARTKLILIDTVILVVLNVCLNYIMIFGKFGLPAMGIEGAGWASTIAEIVAFVVFVVWMFFDKEMHRIQIFKFPSLDFTIVKQVYKTSFPIVLQSVVGLGSWFVFFVLVEIHLGGEALQASNIVRNTYLVLSIPCWGFAAGINTLVSNFIGRKKRQAVIPLVWKTAKINLLFTVLVAAPILIFPEIFLYPVFGKEDMSLIYLAKPALLVVIPILIVFCIGAIFMNGMMATGETKKVLYVQIVATLIYIIYCYLVIAVLQLDIAWAWAAEIIYWVFIWLICYQYLRTKRWYNFKM